jgi:hypothetical protein
MDIKYLTNKFLKEAIEKRYQKQFDNLYSSWKTERPNLSLEDAETIYNSYRNVLGSINMEVDAVKRFLYMHDGSTRNKRKLELRNLQNIESLTFVELLTFLQLWEKVGAEVGVEKSEVNKEDEQAKKEAALKNIFNAEGAQPTKEKIEESKKMWYDESTAKISEGSVRVYEIFNQTQSIRMGYYYQNVNARAQTIADKTKFGYPWCVTMRGRNVFIRKVDENGNEYGSKMQSHTENQYSSYRGGNNGWTFYFVIDDSKPIQHKYHMASIAVSKNNLYFVTSQYNDGDNQMDWDDISTIFPELEDYEDKLVPRAKDTKELESLSIIEIINENPGDENEFARQTNERQLDYIDAGGNLNKPKSWEMAAKNIRAKYINSTFRENINSRFSNLQFIQAVLKTSKSHLETRLEALGFKDGVNYLIEYYLNKTYTSKVSSRTNPSHKLMINRDNKKVGLFDLDKFTWVTFNGITFADNYSLMGGRGEFYISNRNIKYILEKYTKGNEDSSTLYALFEFGGPTKLTANAYFFTNEQWNKMLKDKKIMPKSDKLPMAKIKDFDPDKDIDIREYTMT